MILHTRGRIQCAEFPVTVVFDETQADILTFEFDDAVWGIGRDLLAAGLMSKAGEMDVRIWPAPDTNEVAIELAPPGKCTIVRLDWDPIATFVRMTYGVVPRGTEYAGIEWNAFPRPVIDGAA